MSISNLTSLSGKLCRHAFILAHYNRAVLLPAVAFGSSPQNSLYKMVKKRTLEARSKLQAQRFPNNQPCVSRKEADDNITPPTEQFNSLPTASAPAKIEVTPPPKKLELKIDPHKTSLPPIPPPNFATADTSLKTKRKIDMYEEEKVEKLECNEIDRKIHNRAADIKVSSSSGKVCKPPPAAAKCAKPVPPPPNKPCDSDADKKNKMLLLLLAALGAGGLLLWLLSRRKKDNNSGSPIDEEVCPHPNPMSSADLPNHVPYLLIGGGTASFSAFRAIKSNDPKAKVLMITNEYKKPYMRPPLSKELWFSSVGAEIGKDYRFKQWTGSERSLFFEPEEFFVSPTKLMSSVNGGIAVAQGFTVKKINAAKRVVTLQDGYEISYDECLIATGCSPKTLTVLNSAPLSVREKVMVYRTPEDFERLKRYADAKKSITIVGNGFIGSELACSLANYVKDQNNCSKIYQVFAERGNMSKLLPDYLSKWTTKKIEALGVCVVPNAKIKEAQRDESTVKLVLSNGTTIVTDIVVVCVGCEANTKLAILSGLEVDRNLGGFVVNAELEARRNLFVAGDASCFYDPLLGRRRVEHHDHSVVSGRLAGENMVGKKKPYDHQSMFWSDLGPEIGYEGIGIIDSSLPTVGIFALPNKTERNTDNLAESNPESVPNEPCKKETAPPQSEGKCNEQDPENFGRGVVFYLRDNKIVGILLWNLFNRVGLARTIISQNKKYDDLNEVAKLFEIHT